MGLDSNEEILKEYIDITSVKGNTDAFIAEVSRARSAYESLAKAKIDIGNSKSVGDISKANIQAEKEQQALIKSQIELEKLKKLQIQTENELLRQKKLQNAESEKQLKLQQQAAGGAGSVPFEIKTGGENDAENLKKTGAVVSDLNLKEAELTNTSYQLGQAQQSVSKSTILARKEDEALIKARLALKQANSEQNVELQGLNLQRQLSNKAAKEEAQLALGLLSPYQLLSKKYNEVALNAKDLAVVYGANSIQAKTAAAEALKLNVQLQGIDKTVGQSQRNVGNYTSALGKAFSVIQRLAYILPGVGIAGIIGFVVDPIVDYISSLTGASEATKKLAEENKKFAASIDEIKVKAQLTNNELQGYVSIAKDQTQAIDIRNAALEKANKILGEHGEKLTLVNLETAAVTERINKFTEATIQQSLATKYADRITDMILKAKDLGKQYVDAFNEFNKFQKGADDGIVSQQKLARERTKFEAIRDAYRDVRDQITGLNGELKDAQLKALQLFSDLDKKEGPAGIIGKIREELDKLNKDLPNLLTEDAITENVKKQKELNDELDRLLGKEEKRRQDNLQNKIESLDATFKLYENEQNLKIKAYQRDIDSDNTHYEDKLSILDKYVQARRDLIVKSQNEEIRLAVEKFQQDKQRLEEDKKGKSPAEIKRINDNIATLENNLAQQILIIHSNKETKLQEMLLDSADKRNAIIKAYLDKEKDLYEEYAKKEQDIYDATLDRFKAALQKREQAEKDAAQKRLDLEKELQDQKMQLAEKGGNFVIGLLIDSLDRQKNINNQLKDQIDKQKDAELAANDARVQSEQDKAANIVIINSRAAQEKEKIDKKNAELEVRKAKFERTQQIFEIGIDTIKTLAKIKLQMAVFAANPLTESLAALAATQIPIALLSSALSIAAILAKPIPRYFKGKGAGESVPGGLGMINDNPDGKTKEVLEHSDGSYEFPDGRNVVMPIKNSTRIHPDRDAWLNAVLNAAHRDATNMMVIAPKDQGPDTTQVLHTHTKLLKQIANKKELSLGSTSRGMEALWRHQANIVKYTNENTNWNG